MKRPLVLVHGGCSSHYNTEIVAQAVDLKVIIFSLPYNSIYLIQTLEEVYSICLNPFCVYALLSLKLMKER